MDLAIDSNSCQVCGNLKFESDSSNAVLLNCPRCDLLFVSATTQPVTAVAKNSYAGSAGVYLQELLVVVPPRGRMLLVGNHVDEFAELAGKKGFNVAQMDTAAIEFQPSDESEQYDLAVLFNALEYSTNLNQLFQQIRKKLVPDGFLFLVTPTTDDVDQSRV